ncbi:MAG: S8 family serine peptidase [Armatimonadota bacterium]
MNTETKLVRCFRRAPAVLALTVGIASIASSSQAQTISPYAATQKQNMGNNRYKVLAGGGQYDPNTLLVQFRTDASDDAKNSCCRKVGLGAIDKYKIVDGLALIHVASGDPVAAMAVIVADPTVIRAGLNYIVTTQIIPNDPLFGSTWGMNNTASQLNDIDAPQAWDLYTGDPNYRVAVIDTGIDFNHPDLQGNIWSNPGEIANDGIDNDGNGYIDDVRGWNFVTNTNNPQDGNGHGTHVSGTIAAKGNNGIGVAGVAWNAKIVPLKFLSDTGSGTTANAIKAIDYCTSTGIKLSNNSWGGGLFDSILLQAITNAGAADHLFIAAAGNSALNIDVSPSYPASYNLSNMVNVASTTNTGTLSNFSNFGVGTVPVGAPGSNVFSTWPIALTVLGQPNGYNSISGTSMATPHVTGLAALLRGKMPGWTASQVRSAILGSTKPLASLAGKVSREGIISAYNALAATNVEAIPPTVTAVRTPATANAAGWNNANVTVAITGTDNVGGSGVRDIRYTLNAGTTITVPGATTNVAHTTDGIATIAYWATDNSNNASAVGSMTVRVDKTAPVTTITATPGATSTSVVVSGTDATSGLAGTFYSVDGAPAVAYSGPITLDNGVHTVTAYSTDIAGNTEAVKTLSLPLGSLSTVSVNPVSVNGGTAATGTVTLGSPAPAGGVVVALTSSSAAAVVPASVTVAVGATTATFAISTTSVVASTPAVITASSLGVSKTTTLTVNPAVAAVTFNTLTLSPTSVRGGRANSTATITLSAVTPTALVVNLTSSNTAAATVPVTVTVPAGARTVTFTVTSVRVTTNRTAVISGTALGVTRSATLTVQR